MPRPSGAPSDVRVCIAGVGLIGGSLGQALRRVRRGGRRVYRVVGLGRSEATLRRARRLGAIDEGFTRPSAAVRGAQVVVLCVPVQDILPLARRLAPFLSPGTVVTDVGSVKSAIVDGMARALGRRRDVAFVGGHPMAGSEKIGVENADPKLFRGATCVLTPGRGASKVAVAVVRTLWRDAGATALEMSARLHDDGIALTSHLPHLLAFALVSEVSAAARRHPAVRALVAGSFRDMTRVAGSDPHLWSGVFSLNRAALGRALGAFGRRAAAFRRNDARALAALIARAGADKKSLR